MTRIEALHEEIRRDNERLEAELKKGYGQGYGQALLAELHDCNRLAALGDPEPLRRWCKAMQDL